MEAQEQRTELVAIRLTPTEKLACELNAHTTVSEFIRACIHHCIRRQIKLNPKKKKPEAK